ncbi:uncharacterized protein [Solanum lycopersicum]|uniref:uncharacterized protein n=1 Tax=Solanum lycopersicum TaxID=4081 RepID=UPI00374856AD
MTHAKQVEGDNIREHAKENKKDRIGNYDYSQQKSGSRDLSKSQQKFLTPDPLFSSVHYSKNMHKCGQSSHKLRDCSSRQVQGGCNGKAQSTTSAASSSRLIKPVNLSGTSGDQHQSMVYDLQALQDKEGSPDVLTGMLRVFVLDVYALLDLGATLSFLSLHIAFQFVVSPKTLSKTFSVSTPVGYPVIARWVYKNFLATVSQKVT